MYFVYILRSQKNGRHYYGSSGDVQRRLREHNAGGVSSTRNGRPWVIHYLEEYSSKSEATGRERFFKGRSGYKWLRSRGVI